MTILSINKFSNMSFLNVKKSLSRLPSTAFILKTESYHYLFLLVEALVKGMRLVLICVMRLIMIIQHWIYLFIYFLPGNLSRHDEDFMAMNILQTSLL